MQSPLPGGQPKSFFHAARAPGRPRTCSVSRHSYKPSGLLTELMPQARTRSRGKFRRVLEKSMEERKTRKKALGHPAGYFRTIPPDTSIVHLEEFLFLGLFGSMPRDSVEVPSKAEMEESMEIVHLKNGSVHFSKVFSSNVFENSPQKPTTVIQIPEISVCDENDPGRINHRKNIYCLIEQLDTAIAATELDSLTRYKLLESLMGMRKALQGQREPMSRSFTKYLSGKR